MTVRILLKGPRWGPHCCLPHSPRFPIRSHTARVARTERQRTQINMNLFELDTTVSSSSEHGPQRD